MALIEIKMPDDLLLRLSRLEERTDEIVPKMLEAGGEVALEQVRVRLKAVIGQGTKSPSRSTGELVAALGCTPAKLDRNGNHNVKIGFNEPRSNQYSQNHSRKGRKTRSRSGERSYYEITNAMIANVLEHGRHGQPPRPFLKPARIASREACIAKMKQIFEEEVQK